MHKTKHSGLSYKILQNQFSQKPDAIEENQQHHWIQHVKIYRDKLKFFQLQKKLKFVGQCYALYKYEKAPLFDSVLTEA